MHNYLGSVTDVVKALRKLKHLECLTFHDCESFNDLVSTVGLDELPTKIPLRKKQKLLHVKTLIFDRTSPSTVLFILTCVANPIYLTNLTLYLNEFKHYKDEPKIVLWIFKVINELTSLRHFSTDIFNHYEDDTPRFARMQKKNFYSYLISQLKRLNLSSLSLLNGSGTDSTLRTECEFRFDNFVQLFENELPFLRSILKFAIDFTLNCAELQDSHLQFLKFVVSQTKETMFDIFLNCFECKINRCSSSCVFENLVAQQKASNSKRISFQIRL